MKNKYLVVTIVISNLCFWVFLAFGISFWLDNRAIKMEGNKQYLKIQEFSAACSAAESTATPDCHELAIHRLALEKIIIKSSHYDSLTRLFIAFAIFIPLISWASYFLTRAIFN